VAKRRNDRSPAGHSRRDNEAIASAETTLAREQATHVRVGSETGTLKEKGNRPQITLKNGAVVDARRAVTIVEQLQIELASHPEEFKSLVALAEGRPQDADPAHFEELFACAFLENDHAIEPIVRDLLLNSYQVTPEGPVVVPLRLQDAADLPAAQRAQRQSDRQLRSILRKLRSDGGPSPD
jgi:hypothetical protein